MKNILSCISLLMLLILCFNACGGENIPIMPPKPPQNPTTPDDLPNNTQLTVTINEVAFIAELLDNETSREFVRYLPLTINMSAMPHEKYYYLPNKLPTNAEAIRNIKAGDLMLWGTDCLVLFYESFSTSYSYTRIGQIKDTLGLEDTVGNGNVTVRFEVLS